MNMPQVVMQRTLHPVGQGAFYTEQFLIPNKDFEKSQLFNVVLDCGSETSTLLENEIINTFPKGSVIDMLFLSHFHADHINGVDLLIDRCKFKNNLKPIRYLFLPLLNDQQKIIASLETGIDKFGANDLSERFSAEKIIFIKPLEDSDNEDRVIRREIQGNENAPEYEYASIPLDRIPDEIKSGTGVKIGGINNWIYIPFNAVDSELYSKFLNFLKEEKKTHIWNKIKNIGNSYSLNDISERFDKSDWQEIKRVYIEFHEKILKDRNSSSLLVYSGPCLLQKIKNGEREWEGEPNVSTILLKRRNYWLRKFSGALYTGDIKLTDIIKYKNALQETVLTHICNILKPVIDYVGLIQVPHHGSRFNFYPKIIIKFPNARSYFFSYGENNNYGHPWQGIKILLNACKKDIIKITDNPDTVFYQIVKILN